MISGALRCVVQVASFGFRCAQRYVTGAFLWVQVYVMKPILTIKTLDHKLPFLFFLVTVTVQAYEVFTCITIAVPFILFSRYTSFILGIKSSRDDQIIIAKPLS